MDQDHAISSVPATGSASCSRTSRVPTESSDDVCSFSRELAVRASNGTQVRLLWRQGTRQLWVEVREPELDVTIEIPADPERALEVFHHPYAYATAHNALPLGAEQHAA